MKRYVFADARFLLHLHIFYFMVMFYSHSTSGQQVPINLFNDGSTVNISFHNYSTINPSGQVVENSIIVLPLSSVTINIIEIPPAVKFILIQTHSYLYNITLSYNKVLTPNFYTNGTNIGLVQLLGTYQKVATFVLINPNLNINASVLIAAQGYGNDAPIPGGCNMEFPVEIAPFLSVAYNDSLIWVESQPAAMPLSVEPPISRACEMNQVQLEMYHLFLPEQDFSSDSYFSMIRMMMTVEGIREYGRRVEIPQEGSPMRRKYSAYPGTGSVYGVVAVAVDNVTGAAYVPTVTYACNVVYWTDRCEVLTTTFSKVLCAIIFFLGFFICFFGHRFFKSEMFLFGFLAASLVSYIVFALNGTLDLSAIQGLAIVSGLVFGSFWLLFWCCFGIPLVSVLLATTILGYLVAAISMYAGVGDYQLFDNDINFWVVFISITCTMPIIFISEVQKANILCCGVLGAYAIIIPVDHYIGANLKYILVNTLRRATVPEFRTAQIDPPFQLRDMILVATWFVLASLGATYQHHSQRGRPPFPAPMCRTHERRQRRTVVVRREDRTPLLADDSHSGYGSVTSTPGADSVFETPGTSQRNFTILPKFTVTTARIVAANKELF